jgi:hypothetical protein
MRKALNMKLVQISRENIGGKRFRQNILKHYYIQKRFL